MKRRTFIQLSTAATVGMVLPSFTHSLAFEKDIAKWDAGEVAHIIPTANENRFLIKTSLRKAFTSVQLKVGKSRYIDGVKTDIEGRFWYFDVPGLQNDTQYNLQLIANNGKTKLCDSWPLKTFPDPDSKPQKLRILAYTCAGGYDGPTFKGKTGMLDMHARKKLLEKGMSFNPDIVIANGDHIYWDLQTSLNKPTAEFYKKEIESKFGALDISMPFNTTKNLPIFESVCDYQIAGLYGNTLRSTPSFFLTDDHDMFENDEFDSKLATLPADDYGIVGAELTQLMYYPEFLPDRNRPVWLRGGDKAGRAPGTNMLFGTIRYGSLLEAAMYDCRRFVDYKGEHAKVIPQWTENWINARTLTEDTSHFFQIPSLPLAYSSGKLGDWYPDLLDDENNKLVLYKQKLGWQPGWFAQHQRLIENLAKQQKRPAVVLQGDFHASAAGKILQSGELDLSKNPINIIMTGTLGTGDLAFPSAFRSIPSTPSQLIHMEQTLTPQEKNGFSIIDITPEKVSAKMFLWRPPQPVEEIDALQPVLTYEAGR
jgi:hypothetical protein